MSISAHLPRASVLAARLSLPVFFAFAPELFAAGLSEAESGVSSVAELLEDVGGPIMFIGVFAAFLLFLFSGLSGRAMWGAIGFVLIACWGIGNVQAIVDFATSA